jgi:hypothetical protein
VTDYEEAPITNNLTTFDKKLTALYSKAMNTVDAKVRNRQASKQLKEKNDEKAAALAL